MPKAERAYSVGLKSAGTSKPWSSTSTFCTRSTAKVRTSPYSWARAYRYRPPAVVDEAVRVEVVGLRALAVERVVGDARLALVEDRVDQPRDDVLLLRVVLPRVGPGREELLDPREERQALRGEGLADPAERRLQVLAEGRPAEEGQHVLAEVEGGELGQREALGELLPVALDEAPDLLAVGAVVVDREAGLLQRLDVAADRALGDPVRRRRASPSSRSAPPRSSSGSSTAG